jgi:hypothetical protein
LLALSGCGGAVDVAGSASGTAHDGGPPGPGVDASAGAVDATVEADTGSGTTCGGFVGSACPSPQDYCRSSTGGCNHHDEPATCEARPGGCPKNYAPVCGCDGHVYPNDCSARANGVDVSIEGGCTAPSGTFACGPSFCPLQRAYCERNVSDVGPGPFESYACLPLPFACVAGNAPVSCYCLRAAPCGSLCSSGSSPGSLTLTCPGG